MNVSSIELLSLWDVYKINMMELLQNSLKNVNGLIRRECQNVSANLFWTSSTVHLQYCARIKHFFLIRCMFCFCRKRFLKAYFFYWPWLSLGLYLFNLIVLLQNAPCGQNAQIWPVSQGATISRQLYIFVWIIFTIETVGGETQHIN